MNKKAIICSFALVIFALFCVSGPAFAFWGGDTAKAEKMMDEALGLRSIDLESNAVTKLYSARELLISELSKDSNNLKALFLLAKCEHYLYRQKSAYDKFTVVFEKDRSYGNKIFRFYSQVADQELNAGHLRKSIEYRLFAVRFNMQKSGQIVQDLISKGEKYLAKGNFKTGHTYLETIRKYTSKYNSDIAQTYFEQGKSQLQAGNLREAHEYFGAARNITNDFDPEIAQLCYNSAEKAPSPEMALMLYDWSVLYSSDYKTRAVEKIKPIVKQLGASSIQKISHIPRSELQNLKKIALNYKIYGPSSEPYYFKASKKGEKSDHWIRVKRDTKMTFQSKHGKYAFITRSGKKYYIGNLPHPFDEDYKVLALSKVDMRILFE